MRISELLRLVWININQNRFKTIMTSIGIVVGAATIVMVIAIGRGGQMDVAEQFSSLNAGAIDVSYEYAGTSTSSAGFSIGSFMQNMFGGGGGGGMPSGGGFSNGDSGSSGGRMPSGGGSSNGDSGSNGGGMPSGGASFGGNNSGGGMPSGGDASDNSTIDGPSMEEEHSQESAEDTREEATEDSGDTDADGEEEEDDELQNRLNQENIILTAEDVSDIETYVSGVSGVTISYTTKATVEGGDLTEGESYTIAGVKENYADISNLTLADGEFFTDEDDETCSRVCVLGSTAAKAIFGSVSEATGSTIYIDDRSYTVVGVLKSTQTVSAGITPDEAVLIPYDTGIKYLTGQSVSPTITVIAEDVNDVSRIEADVQTVLSDSYDNAEFTFEDAGSKMEAAESSNRILTVLLTAMACIVFIVGGIGIMNVLFVSVKERTNEIGILKALGASRGNILFEFLVESSAISLIGGTLGVAISFIITPIVEYYGVRVEANITAWAAALGFAVLTGTLFGFYPAWKASRLIPVEALNAE